MATTVEYTAMAEQQLATLRDGPVAPTERQQEIIVEQAEMLGRVSAA